MKELTPEKRKKLERLAKVVKGGNIAILGYINELEEKFDQKIAEVDKLNPKLEDVFSAVKGAPGVDGKDGEKGEKGDKGEPGVDGKVIKGTNGKDGKDGRDGRDGLDGRDGVDGNDGQDGSPDTSEQVRDKLETLKGNERLHARHIDGLDDEKDKDSLLNRAIAILDKRTQYLINKVVTASNSFITSITTTGTSGAATVINGVLNIPQYSSGGSFTVLVPTGTVNGTNLTFVFTTAPQVVILDNGNVMNQTSSDGTVNWTGTTTITLNQAPNNNIFGF